MMAFFLIALFIFTGCDSDMGQDPLVPTTPEMAEFLANNPGAAVQDPMRFHLKAGSTATLDFVFKSQDEPFVYSVTGPAESISVGAYVMDFIHRVNAEKYNYGTDYSISINGETYVERSVAGPRIAWYDSVIPTITEDVFTRSQFTFNQINAPASYSKAPTIECRGNNCCGNNGAYVGMSFAPANEDTDDDDCPLCVAVFYCGM